MIAAQIPFPPLFFMKEKEEFMTKTIQIRISPQGQATVKTEGYSGTECRDATKIFEDLGRVVSDTATAEMYGTEQIQGIVLENGGNHDR